MRLLDKVDCLDSSAVHREKNISRRGFVSSWGGWIGKEEWFIFWVCTSVFIRYGGNLVMSYHKVSNLVNCMRQVTLKVTVANWVIAGGAGALQQLYSENSENLVCSLTWSQRSWFLLCSVSLSGVQVRRRGWRWISSKELSPKPCFWVVWEKSSSLLATRQSVTHLSLTLCCLSVYL